MILVIDHYDSFTYNLVQYFGEIGEEVIVRRIDEIDLQAIEAMDPQHIVISSGSRTPYGIRFSMQIIDHFKGIVPMLGVSLGHQCIAEAFGGEVISARQLMIGKTSPMLHDGRTLFRGLPSPFAVTRYHSFVVHRTTLPDCLEISAETAEGDIMALRHKVYPIEGVQFQPESITTEHGQLLLRNFIQLG